MTRQKAIEQTIEYLNELPEDKVMEIHDFAEFLRNKYEEIILQKGMEKLQSESESFKFLEQEENIYTINDVKEKYNEKG